MPRCSRNIRRKSNRYRISFAFHADAPVKRAGLRPLYTPPSTQLTGMRRSSTGTGRFFWRCSNSTSESEPAVLTNNASEQPSNPEEEFVMPGVAVCVGRFHRPENGIDDDAQRAIGREAGCLVHHAAGRAINLRSLIRPEEINAAAEQAAAASPAAEDIPPETGSTRPSAVH